MDPLWLMRRRFQAMLPGGRRSREVPATSSGQTQGEAAYTPQPPLTPDGGQPDLSSTNAGDVLTFPDGVKVWHSSPDACVDICFVHGLTGNRDNTWTAHGQSTAWPKALLPSRLPRACLLTYGYDAYVVQKSVASANRLLDHAMNFLNDLTNDRARRDASSHPLILVAHSLGGLVCKKAILLSRNHPEPHLHDIFDHVIGIAFMGTPHKGSWMAHWAKIPATALKLVKSSNKSLLTVLETGNQLLECIQAEFLSMVREVRDHGRRLDVTCFFEELPLLPVARHVVSKQSATIDGYTAISIHANHRDMARFVSDKDNGFQRILGELLRWTARAESTPNDQHGSKAARMNASASIDTIKPEREPCYYIPFPTNKRFVGRESILERLQEMLFAQKCQRVALVGLGGIGKTQVALQLAYWVKAYWPEYSIFWVPVLSRATFEEAYDEISRRLPIQDRSDEEDSKELVRRYLCSAAAGPWLLIVDNADDKDVLFGSGGFETYIPESEHGLILFTTRSREVAIEAAGNSVVDLGEMNRSEAMKFLEKSLIRNDLVNVSDANELLDELTCLPLAISQATAYLNKNQLSIPDYLRLLRSTEADMVSLLSREFRDNTRYQGSQNAIAATWLVSFEQIRRSDSVAAGLLSFIAFIEPKAIPQSILPTAEVEEHFINAIGTLCGYAFLVRRGNGDIFDMHSLVHVATKIWLDKHDREEDAEVGAIAHLTTTFQTIQRTDRDLWRTYLPHALRMLYQDRNRHAEEKAGLFTFVGRCLRMDRRSTEAVACLQEACRWRQRHLHEQDRDRLLSEHELAVAYSCHGYRAEAIAMLRHVVAMKQATLAEDDLDRLMSEQALGTSYFEDDQFEEAINVLEPVMAILRKARAEDDVDRLTTEHTLALAYRGIGQTLEAITILRHIVEAERKILPERNHDRLASENELARSLLENGKFDEALGLAEHVVAIQGAVLPVEDVLRLGSEWLLGQIYHMTRRRRKAMDLLEHVLAVYQRIAVEEDISRLGVEYDLALVYADDGQVEKAAELLKHVIGIQFRKMVDGNDPLSLAAVAKLARIYEENGEPEQAVKWQEDVAAFRKSMLAE